MERKREKGAEERQEETETSTPETPTATPPLQAGRTKAQRLRRTTQTGRHRGLEQQILRVQRSAANTGR